MDCALRTALTNVHRALRTGAATQCVVMQDTVGGQHRLVQDTVVESTDSCKSPSWKAQTRASHRRGKHRLVQVTVADERRRQQHTVLLQHRRASHCVDYARDAHQMK